MVVGAMATPLHRESSCLVNLQTGKKYFKYVPTFLLNDVTGFTFRFVIEA